MTFLFIRLSCRQIVYLIFLLNTLTSPTISHDNICSLDIPECSCETFAGSLSVDCSDRGLTEFPSFGAAQFLINHLDLSRNKLIKFPTNLNGFPLLKTLYLSDNHINYIPASALADCAQLQHLYLNSNNISYWGDIHPSTLLKPAINLETFSLSNNPLTTFTTDDRNFILNSSSLKLLDLSYCQFSRITDHILQGLPKIEHLLLNDNPIHMLGDISSESLKTIILNNCKLSYLRSTIFSKLPSLTFASLSRNHRLSLERQNNDTIRSQSLKQIDISFCNMDAIELQSFPNLVTAVLKGNLINHLNRFSFESNSNLQNIDLSYNAITNMTSGSFRNLKYLKRLDLSFNMIRRIERETFKHNDYLTDINLSRNYVDRFNRIVARSLTYLNISWCEIMTIDLDAFADMPELIQLDLSNNLFIDFPASLRSDTLQTLDLGRCRLTTIRNETFQGFPELSTLNLAGNRFTRPFHKEFFADNPYLRDIWLGDNPWRCECSSSGFYELYLYLTNHPSKVNDRGYLRCLSPDEVYGQIWDVACFNVWFINTSQLGLTQKIWLFLMVGIMVFAATICIFMSVKKCVEERKALIREEELRRNVDEAREIARLNRIRLEQQGQINAPDPRESHPPCYADAIRLPRLDGNYVSLEDISLKRNKRKIKETQNAELNDNEAQVSRRNRSRSENVLSVNERALRSAVNLPLLPVPDVVTTSNEGNTISTTANLDLHYHSTDILALDHGTPAITLPTQCVENLTIPDDLVEDIQNFEHTNSSPYPQRRLKPKPPNSNHHRTLPNENICIVENFYNNNNNSTDASSTSDEFTSFSPEEVRNIQRNV